MQTFHGRVPLRRSTGSTMRHALVAVSPDASRGRFTIMRTPSLVGGDVEVATSVGYSGGAGDTALMRHKLANAEEYYFGRGDSVCRLCNEYVAPSQVNFHMYGSGPRGPSTHIGREIVLDSLIYHAKRGYDPAAIVRSWPYLLARCPNYVRLPELWPDDLSDLPERCRRLTALLMSLKKMNVLKISISPHSDKDAGSTPVLQRLAVKRRVAFERLECIGDNAWGNHMAARMMRVFADKGWHECKMFHSFNTMRDLAETNSNLERLFDLLQLNTLLPPGLRDLVGEGKMKADVFESVIGELDMYLYGLESNMWGVVEYTEVNGENLGGLCTVIRHTLNEIYDLTLLTLLFGFAEHGVALASEIAKSNLTFGRRPEIDAGTEVRTRRPVYREGFVPQFHLPMLPSVYSQPLRAADLPPSEEQFGPAVHGETRRVVRFRSAALWSKFVAASEYNTADAVARGQEELGKASDLSPERQRELEQSITPPVGLYDRTSDHFRRLSLQREKHVAPAAMEPVDLDASRDIQPPFTEHTPSPAVLAARRIELLQAARTAVGVGLSNVGVPFSVLSPIAPFAIPPLLQRSSMAASPAYLSDEALEAAMEKVDEQWRALWGSRSVEKFFTADVDASVVLAQYEASFAMRGSSKHPGDDEVATQDVSSLPSERPDETSAPLVKRHRFVDGITIGSGEGKGLLHMTADSVAVTSGTPGARMAKSTVDAATGAIDLEEIKRRNQEAARKAKQSSRRS